MNSRKIIIVFFIIITLSIGYIFLSGKDSNIKQSKQLTSPTPVTTCSAKQLYQSNFLNVFIITTDNNIATLSGQIKQIEDMSFNKPTESLEEFRKGMPAKLPKLDDETYNKIIQQEYNTYLHATGEILSKGFTNIQKIKDKYILPKKSLIEKMTELKSTLIPFVDKLKQCKDIDRVDLQQKLESSNLYTKEGVQKILILLFETNSGLELQQKIKEFKSLTSTPSPKP